MSGFALPRAVAWAFAVALSATPPCATAAPTVAPEPSPSGPAYGDLSNLTFSATGSLVATLIAPAPGGVSDIEAATFEVATVAGAGTELSVGGQIVSSAHIGKRTVDKKSGETHYFYYGVRLAPGPNDIAVTALGAGDLRGAAQHEIVYGQGQPVREQARLAGD